MPGVLLHWRLQSRGKPCACLSSHGSDMGIASKKRGEPSLINPVLSTCPTGNATTLTNPLHSLYLLSWSSEQACEISSPFYESQLRGGRFTWPRWLLVLVSLHRPAVRWMNCCWFVHFGRDMTVNKCSLHVRICFLIDYNSAIILRQPRDESKVKPVQVLLIESFTRGNNCTAENTLEPCTLEVFLSLKHSGHIIWKEPNTAVGSGMGIKYSPHNDLGHPFALSLYEILVSPRKSAQFSGEQTDNCIRKLEWLAWGFIIFLKRCDALNYFFLYCRQFSEAKAILFTVRKQDWWESDLSYSWW